MERTAHPQSGASLIEVLVTIVIIAFGLLGMAGLQTRLQVSEMEAYQRAQALVLLNDMANRLTTNRAVTKAGTFVTATDIGPSTTCSSLTLTDSQEWCSALQGASVTSGTSKVGAMIGGRGCVADLGSNEYMITVAWQGLFPISAPPSSVTCGSSQFDTGGNSGCTGDLCRRVVTTIIRIAPLT